MKMITPNKKAKNGFSLVEMLVVIAIIAILVSIIIPVVHHNTVKAAAATNAANLRAIEGKLKILRLQNPEDFATALTDSSSAAERGIIKATNALSDILDYIFGSGATEEFLEERYAKFDAENGVLTLYDPNVIVDGVPTSQKMKVRGTKEFDSVEIAGGVEMTVYITETDISATYGQYGVDVFADIAEDGKLNETTIEGGANTDANALNALNCIAEHGSHNFDATGICRNKNFLGIECGYCNQYHVCVDKQTLEVISIGIAATTRVVSNTSDGLCDICFINLNHTCVDVNPTDHRCDEGCGQWLSDCDEREPKDKKTHVCSVCGLNEQQHTFSGGYCLECQREEHITGTDCYDENKDHYCDFNGCTNGDVGEHKNSPVDGFQHHCTYCSSDKEACTLTKTATHHSCSVCNRNEEHTFVGDGETRTCVCGHTCAHEDKTGGMLGGGDGFCDYCDYDIPDTSNSCVTPDTLVTMADGSKKRVDEITYDDLLLVWDFFEGKYTAVPASVIVFHGMDDYVVTELIFEDGTSVKTIGAHDFFSVEANEFISIDSENVASFVGNHFIKADGDSYTAVELVDYDVRTEYTGSYSLLSAKHNNFIVEDMFSLTPLLLVDTPNFFEYFEVGEGMKYDEAKMKADIEKYGLYTYEDFKDYLTYEQYVALNAPYYKVIVGRGEVTFEDLLTAISAYVE